MGLFDFFQGNKSGAGSSKRVSDRELARLTRLVGDKLAQNYDRQEAIQTLSRLANAEGARALLKRFNFTMEPSITDLDEKEAAVEGIVAAGNAALEPLRAYCSNAHSLSWPIRIFRRILGEEELISELLSLLDQFDTEYVRDAEPKIDLIKYLEDHPHAEVREAVEPFLQDVNESVRFHAVGTILAMGDGAGARALVAALEEEESLRVKNRVAAGLAQRGWEIPEALRPLAEEHAPDGYLLLDGKLVSS
jgi:HEAT repeat protein